ncbi:PstS family phosphate ABC transporter substrate-binding protein [Actinobacteria bacterium YIM 96077]|uniref:Phosphate-binding protein n=1 Tax=Phytoactinopolyspora halophila TaxID=1981511 RepID=A0A329R4Q9_9ACTN|nr:PstS family phosphate ABC transporter substrate-binding protein [Phytoactinopolyspora halophila]AYY11861.1 PstS family phosphate ABC transporter substrate-binding protein [Actinobacteria bacterium YIM 96077]RAW18906.1 phosphate ABC transporter substrate-binding protein [Phytoactinopolyspora halophila]
MKISTARRRLAPFAVASAAALLLVACGSDDNDDNGDDTSTSSDDSNSDDSGDGAENASDEGEELSGNIEIDGSSTVAPLSEAAAELFMQQHPDVQVSVGTSGTGGGFELFCNGETDGSDASREISEEEIAQCEENGISFEGIQVANDAMAVVVHPDNPVQCLTTDQLNQIWGPDSTLSNWNEIDGLEEDFDESLDLYGPGTDSGTFDYFTEAINGEAGAQRTDYNNIGEDDNSGILGVEGSVGGMFYVGYSYYVENQDRVRALEIDGGEGCTAPSPETVESYVPLTRPLFVYMSDVALERPEVQAFADFYVNQENETIAEQAGFIGMTEEQAAAASEKVDSLIGN